MSHDERSRHSLAWVRGAVVGLALAVAVPSIGLAQEATPTLELPRLTAYMGYKVWVTTADGRTRSGTLLGQYDQGLDVRFGDSPARVDGTEIREVVVRLNDGVGDGALRGLVFGGVGGVTLGFVGAANCGAFCGSTGRVVLGLGALGAGIGAVAGLVADAMHKERRTIYRRRSTRTVRVTPLVSTTVLGGHVSVTWGGN